jgi:hypothetical protein
MAHFWKTADGQWRKGIIALVMVFLSSAVYDFVREGLGSFSGIQYLLFAISTVALAPAVDEPEERRLKWYVPRSTRHAAGAVVFAVAAGMFLYGVARDILR